MVIVTFSYFKRVLLYILYSDIFRMCDITILKYLWMRWYDVWDGP